MSQRKRALNQELQRLVPTKSKMRLRQARPQDGDTSTAIALAQRTPSERVLLRRVYFLNPEKTKFFSLGYYPARNYDPCGNRRSWEKNCGPNVVLSVNLTTSAEIVWKYLCERIFRTQRNVISIADVGKNKNNVCKLIYDKKAINFKLNELIY